MTVTELVDRFFQAYGARRRPEACRTFAERLLAPDVRVSLTGALTPAGHGAFGGDPLRGHGKANHDRLPDSVVASPDSTVAMPIMAQYPPGALPAAQAQGALRPP